MALKTNREVNVEGKVISNIAKPGIYKLSVDSAVPSTKFVKQDEPEAPTLNITVKVAKAIQVPKFPEERYNELTGKLHTDVIDLSLASDKQTKEKMWENKTSRVAHILSHVGIDKNTVFDVADAAIAKLKSWDDYTEANAVMFAEGIQKLITDEVKKNTTYGKVVGSVFSGKPVCGFQGFNGFITDVESRFDGKELQKISEYYACIDGQTPSSEGAPSGGNSAANQSGDAF